MICLIPRGWLSGRVGTPCRFLWLPMCTSHCTTLPSAGDFRLHSRCQRHQGHEGRKNNPSLHQAPLPQPTCIGSPLCHRAQDPSPGVGSDASWEGRDSPIGQGPASSAPLAPWMRADEQLPSGKQSVSRQTAPHPRIPRVSSTRQARCNFDGSINEDEKLRYANCRLNGITVT